MADMLAAVLVGPGSMELKQYPRPEIQEADDVLISVKACGFCQTDYKAITGDRRVQYPAILGHEGSGIVAACGHAVTWFEEGDEVIIQPSGYCGRCQACLVGNTHLCPAAFTTGGDGPKDVRPGFFAEYAIVKAQMLFKKPQKLSFEQACLTEPLSGAWKGVVQYSQVSLGEDVVVVGVGGIGLLCLMVARAAGAGYLIAIDNSDYALENAKQNGATHVFSPSHSGNLYREVYQVCPTGPDLIIESAGNIKALEQVLQLRRRGTRWNLFGITTSEILHLDAGLEHFLECRMDASFGTTPLAMLKAIRLMERGLVDTSKIISHRFSLKNIHSAIDYMSKKERNKVIVMP